MTRQRMIDEGEEAMDEDIVLNDVNRLLLTAMAKKSTKSVLESDHKELNKVTRTKKNVSFMTPNSLVTWCEMTNKLFGSERGHIH